MADWAAEAREALRRGPAALVTILATEGSAPRGPGARMVVTETGLAGTIGGGRLEHLSAAQARAILAHAPGSWRVQDYPLGPLLGQCCGGRVRLLVEHLDSVPDGAGPFEVILTERVERRLLPDESRDPGNGAAPLGPGFRRGTLSARGPLPERGTRFVEPIEADSLPVLLFGAGHVGRAIAARAAGLPLELGWYDSRPEAAEASGAMFAGEAEIVACAAAAPERGAVVILTHDHGLDYRLAAAALRSPARFVGLIGSRTKRARFVSRLAKDGVDAARLTCPIGLAGIPGREPEVIAIAALAQLLMLRNAG
ncbi:MAG: xanthine dehydrogenase accessory protein XdhC [Sphingomonadaceae bacterium]|nr:xanthine dehydrogenase accessory protein XdhC [Sphingomonadaceae bacterium]